MNILIQGAGRGIGLALAHRAVAAGATQLFLTARQPETSPGFSDLPPGANIHWIPLDNLQPDSIEKAGAQLCQQIDRLDRVITCAGVLKDDSIKPEKRIADIDATALLQAFQVNATGPVLWQRRFGRYCAASIGCILPAFRRVSARSPTTGWAAGMPIGQARRHKIN